MLLELSGRRRAQHLVTVNLGIDDLAQHVAVGEAHDQTVLVGRVLVLVLGNQLETLAIVSATLCNNFRWN